MAAAQDKASCGCGGEVRAEGFYTTDLFPGGDMPEPDWGTRLTLEPRWSARLGGKWRFRPWVRSVIERYRHWSDRDLVRWTVGADLKRGSHRLRFYRGWTRDELYFPSAIGDARLDRVGGGGEVRLGLGSAWMVEFGAEVEREDFVPIHDARDDTRWTWRTSLERGFGVERRLRLVHLYRRSDSASHLYGYEQNAARLEASWRVGGWDFSGQGEAGLRNYRTGLSYASNFGRQDDRWRARGALGRLITPALALQAFGEARKNDSTRARKNYHVTTAGLALMFAR
ncbi:MAG: hypothetical protein ACRENJ_07885 [Candidatus Eiseniibacteriota bacterium]